MAVFVGNNEIDIPCILEDIQEIRVGSELVWQAGLPEGTIFDFEYTGTVQSVELPRGKYKLQCWGAQGGTSAGSSNGVGSKGGYSEGVLTLTEKTTLYVFVGGQGSRGSSTSLVNGGWNGGGASVGYTSYNSGNTKGYSYPACGGGATDISTVTSNMSYSGGMTNRSSASLLARCIVAGGGGGGSYSVRTVTTPGSSTSEWALWGDYTSLTTLQNNPEGVYKRGYKTYMDGGYKYRLSNISPSNYTYFYLEVKLTDGQVLSGQSIDLTNVSDSQISSQVMYLAYNISDYSSPPTASCRLEYYKTTTTPETTDTDTWNSSDTGQGGGVSGIGRYPGTQSSASNRAGFGYGGDQYVTNYRYACGGGGGGWYGGGIYYSNTSTSYINPSGGSGFVNTAANASYRPSGYTGLQLDSGETIAGNTSHPSVSGGTETGHSGNGYARITVIE